MRKILAIAAAAALTAGVSYAANPFSDVSTDDWAYQAVAELSDQGVVEGYPDGTFRGERNMTRYELAQVIARLMAREDELNAEQRATLDKLAGEYADELANLGVRVSNLEKKVGNLYWSGDARMQYQHNLEGAKDHEDTWNGRMRINVMGQVNDKVTVNGRFVNEMDFKDSGSSDTYMDRLFTEWTPAEGTYVRIGRQGIALDQTGTFWDEDGVFDGITAGFDNGRFGIDAGYGYTEANEDAYSAKSKTEGWFARLTDHVADGTDISAFYRDGRDGDTGVYAGKNLSTWGAGASIGLADKLTASGDYVKTKNALDGNKDAALWTAGLTYGEVDTEKAGTWQLGVHYVKAEAGSMLLGNSALDLTDQLDYGYDNGTDIRFWTARAGVALQKGVELDAYYNFGAKASGDVEDPDDTWGIELNYAF